MTEVGTLVRVKEGTPLEWLGHGDANQIHWAAGKVGEVIRQSRTDVVLRVKFDRRVIDVPREANGCQWFHPDELETVNVPRPGDRVRLGHDTIPSFLRGHPATVVSDAPGREHDFEVFVDGMIHLGPLGYWTDELFRWTTLDATM